MRQALSSSYADPCTGIATQHRTSAARACALAPSTTSAPSAATSAELRQAIRPERPASASRVHSVAGAGPSGATTVPLHSAGSPTRSTSVAAAALPAPKASLLPALASMSVPPASGPPMGGSNGTTLGSGTVCHGYVGQGSRPAAEYHECDFDWEEHAAAVKHIVEAQQAQAQALHSGAVEPLQQHNQQQQPHPQRHGTEGHQQGGGPDPVLEGRHGCGVGGSGSSDRTRAGADSKAARVSSPEVTSSAGRQESLLLVGRQGQQQQQQQGQHDGPASTHSELARRQLPGHQGGPDGLTDGHHGPPAEPHSCGNGQPAALSHAEPEHHAAARQSEGRPEAEVEEEAGAGASAPQHSASASTSSGWAAAQAGAPAAAAAAVAPAAVAAGAYEGSKWEEFYRAHPSARFFKERRYLLLEFPALLTARHVAEIGCGCGSSILPVLKANPAARTTCTDISTTCLDQLLAAAAAEGVARDRITVFPADATDPAASPAFTGLGADALLIMFTLSAVPPEQQAVMLALAAAALAPGGLLLIRDHGLYDMVQLRIPADQWVGPNLYKRGDGTMAYFFSTEELSLRAAGAGLRTVECKYVTVINRNRKTGLALRRVFVHGVFEKPTEAGAATAR